MDASLFSKFKYLQGQLTFPGKNNQFTNINMPDQSIEGNAICGNSKYIAMPWKLGGGGCIAVHPAMEFTKFNA